MATNWQMVITSIGSQDPLHDITVQASNWISAIRLGRQKLGENEAVPTGSSCAVEENGRVTVLDAVGQRRYILTPLDQSAVSTSTTATNADDTQPAKAQPAKTQPSAEPAQAQQQQPFAAETSKKRRRAHKTMAYDANSLSDLQVPKHLPDPKTITAAAQQAQAQEQATTKTSSNHPDRSPEGDIATAAQPSYAAQDSQPNQALDQQRNVHKRTPSVGGNASIGALLDSRDVEPTEQTPLLYRERSYLVPAETTLAEAEKLLHQSLKTIQEAIRDAGPGKFVNLAAFDHAWQERPQKPPMVTLQWKDWRDEIKVAFPLRDGFDQTSQPSGRPRVRTSEEENKAANLFEALHDLFFLSTPIEGLEFVARLIVDMIPCEAFSAALYDINTDEFRFVQITGQPSRNQQIVPRQKGLIASAASAPNVPLRVSLDAPNQFYDPQIDGCQGIDLKNTLLISLAYDGELLGMVQLSNRLHKPAFDQHDEEAIDYIGRKLAEFLHQARIKIGQSNAP